MIWYKTGTVSVTNASGNVVGASTKWVANVRDGDAFLGPDGLIYEITGRSSDTALTITPAYRGVTASGKAYALAPMQGYVKRTGDLAAQLLTDVGGALDLKLDAEDLPEGVRATALTGLSTATASVIAVTDSVLVALGKAQAQLNGKETPAGALAQMGSLGIGTASAPMISNYDDTNLVSGMYRGGGATSAGTPPPGLSLTTATNIIVQRWSAVTGIQICTYAHNTAKTWIRTWVGSVWQPWRELAFLDSPTFTGAPVTPNLKLGNVASADVNTLDYYEEGAFTPTLHGNTTAGSPIYANNAGYYTRIGNRVLFSLRMQISAKGGMVGAVRINNLPFAVRNNSTARAPVAFSNFSGVIAGNNAIYGCALPNTAQLELTKFPAAATTTGALTDADISDTFAVYISGQYEV